MTTFGDGSSKSLQLLFQRFLLFLGSRPVLRSIDSGGCQMTLELLQGVVDHFWLQHGCLKLAQKLSFQVVLADSQAVGAGSAIEVLRASIHRMSASATGHDYQIRAARATLQKAGQ